MADQNGAHVAPSSVTLRYQLLRNTTSPDETATGVRSYVVNLAAWEILGIGTRENLRGYLAEYNSRKRNRVHDAIRNTIETEPQRMITRNSGFVVAASDIAIDDNAKTVILEDPSVINGAQSQGEIRRWFKEQYETDPLEGEPPFYVRVEIIVDPDVTEIVETAIARNTATPVKSISQAGARGQLEELERSLQKRFPSMKIRKSETDEDVEDTRKILQYARLLMPAPVSNSDTAAELLRPYKNPEQCLTDFSNWYDARKTDAESALKYKFTIDIAPSALQEYKYWETHEAWNGHHLWEETKQGGRTCRRDRSGKIVWVSPALVFPVIGAMSEFVEEVDGEWKIVKPGLFRPDEMISRAVSQFRTLNSNPILMGRSAGAYEALRIYPATLIEVMRDMSRTAQ